MKTADVIQLSLFRKRRSLNHLEDPSYEAVLSSMNKAELLEEMVRFQSEKKGKMDSELPLQTMIRGRSLFRMLEQQAETKELKILTSAYKKHLEIELTNRINNS